MIVATMPSVFRSPSIGSDAATLARAEVHAERKCIPGRPALRIASRTQVTMDLPRWVSRGVPDRTSRPSDDWRGGPT